MVLKSNLKSSFYNLLKPIFWQKTGDRETEIYFFLKTNIAQEKLYCDLGTLVIQRNDMGGDYPRRVVEVETLLFTV